MRRVPRRLAAVLALVVPAVLLVGCSSGGDADPGDGGRSTSLPSSGTGRPDGSHAPEPRLARFYDQQLVWHGCSGGFECTRLTVPVDYTQPGGGILRVAVNRLPSAGDHRGSLVVNPGGPGVSGLQYARSARSAVSASVREHYDVVGFDPRGIGASRAIDCLTDRELDAFLAQDGTPDSPGEEAELVRQGDLLGAGCLRDDPALTAHMGTRDVARDMDVLRAALGDATLTYLGKSYGTYLGALYAGLFPAKVGRLVLDGPLDPGASNLDNSTSQAIGFQRALGSFLDDCLRRSSCPLHGSRPVAEARLKAVLDRSDGHPLDGLGHRQTTQALATYGLAIGLYDKGYWQFLREAIGQAMDGDGKDLLVLADLYNDRGPGGHYTTNASEAIYAVNCLDRPGPSSLEQLRADADRVASASPIFGAYIVWSNAPCADWPVPSEGEPEPVHATGSAPILVVGTTRDPATPYESAQALAGQLDSGHLLTYDGDGHTAYRHGSSCIDKAVDSYLLDGTVPADGARCG
jgi:pimeloyl-ACP methyl ester carboxylesterase